MPIVGWAASDPGPGNRFWDYAAFFFALIFAHRARCAAAILFRPAADIFRRLRVALAPYVPTKKASAAFNADNCSSTRSRVFLNFLTITDTFAIGAFPSGLTNHSTPVISMD
jgi:hypothetical protein